MLIFPMPPMPLTVILEPFNVDSEDECKLYKEKCNKILRHLQTYCMEKDVQATFSEMLNKLNVTDEKCVKVLRTTIVRPKLFYTINLLKSESVTT